MAYLFPNLSKYITFAAAPLVLTPFVRNQDVLLRGVGTLRHFLPPNASVQ